MFGFVSLELQIILINVISLFGSIWNWFKWNQQLKKISSFSVSDELDVKDIDWLKTVLSWIVIIRFVIDRASFVAFIINIYTIVTRRWQSLLIFWMMLSFLRDIVLEIIVIIITFLQWHKGSISTLLLVEFIAEKTIWLVISTCKWWTILKWYMQLQREAKIRRFTKIAQKSIANIVNVPGRIGRSLNDECFSLAIVRREKYVSLLNLNRISDPGKLFNKINFDLRISKSLTNSVTNNNSHDSNDLSTNDLSVAEKAMKILGITAEDVMDACARIQERSYWSEQDVTAKTPEAMEEKVTQFSLEEDSKKIDNALKKQKNNIVKTAECTLIKKDIMRNSQIEINDRKNKKKINNALKSKETIIDITVDYNLMKNVVMQNPQIDKTKEKDKNKINKKEQILIDEKQDVSSTKSEDVISDELNNCVKSTESYNNGILYKLQKEELKKKKKKKK